MSYQVEVHANGQAYPVIICDQCQQVITDPSENVLWLEAPPGTPLPRRYQTVHTHSACQYAFERAHPHKEGEHWSSNDIDAYLAMLLVNCRYDAKVAKRKVEVLAVLG